MGTWLETCGITHLPIHYGDEVVLFIIEEEECMDRSFSSSTALYKPVSIPIRGFYNGRGCILETDVPNEILLPQFEDQTQVDSVEELIYKVQRDGVLGYKNMMIHCKIYDTLIQEIRNRMVYNNSEMDYISREEQDDRHIKDLYNIYSSSKIKGFSKITCNQNEDINPLGRFLKGQLKYYIPRLDEEYVRSKVKELWLFNEVMNISRKLWTPQSGSGTNYSEYYNYILIAEFVNEKFNELNDNYDKDYTDYKEMKDKLGRMD